MGRLNFIQETILHRYPVQTFHLGRAITLIEIGLELFIVLWPEFIDTVLFHFSSGRPRPGRGFLAFLYHTIRPQ